MHLLIVLLAMTFAVTAKAQDVFPPPKSKAFAGSVLRDALSRITEAECGKSRPCAPATAQEKQNPPLTLAEADFVMRRAILSKMAALCDLDWKARNLQPMMAYMRDSRRMNERQLALVGIIHKTMFELPVSDPSSCDSKMRAEAESMLDFRPPGPPPVPSRRA